MMHSAVSAILILGLSVYEGYALQCWACSSDIDRSCADTFNLTDFGYGSGLYQSGFLGSNQQPYDPYNQRGYDNRAQSTNQNEFYRTTESSRNFNTKDPRDGDPYYSGSNREQNHDYRRPEDRDFRDRPLDDRDRDFRVRPLDDRDRSRDPNYRSDNRQDLNYRRHDDRDSRRDPNHPDYQNNRTHSGALDRDISNRDYNTSSRDYPYNRFNSSDYNYRDGYSGNHTSNNTKVDANPDPWANRDRYYSNQDSRNINYQNRDYNSRDSGSGSYNDRNYYNRNPGDRSNLNDRDNYNKNPNDRDSSTRDPNRDRYDNSRDYNNRDPNNRDPNNREPSTRDPNSRDFDRDYNNRDYRTRDYNSRDPVSRDPLYDRDRNRDPYNRDSNNRDYNARSGTRDPYFDRDNRDPYNRDQYNRDAYNRDPNNRDYPPRDVNRDYNQQGRSYDPNIPSSRDFNYQRAQALSASQSGPRLVTCNEEEARLRRMRNVCIKKVQRIGEQQLTYIRRCEMIPFEKEIGTCYDPVARGISLDFCEYCERDGCNSATGLKFNIFLASFVPVVLLWAFFS